MRKTDFSIYITVPKKAELEWENDRVLENRHMLSSDRPISSCHFVSVFLTDRISISSNIANITGHGPNRDPPGS
jgi:hypothetical protein